MQLRLAGLESARGVGGCSAVIPMKRHIIKYKSFEEAREDAMQQFITRRFDADVAAGFFNGYKSSEHFKPGLLKFKSFKEARDYDMQNLILRSIEGRLK